MEEGSAAYSFPDPVEDEVKRRRLELLTEIQLDVVDAYCAAQVGNSVLLLCEGFEPESGRYVGRSYAESPDIDGCIYIEGEEDLIPGEFYRVRITEAVDGELIAALEEAHA